MGIEDFLGNGLRKKVEETSPEVVRKLYLENLKIKKEIIDRPDVIIRDKLRNLKDLFYDREAIEEENKNELIYKTFLKKNKGLSYKFTVINPGKIGKEYYKTKGHFHRNAVAAEIYFVLEGNGILLLQHQRTDRCIFAPMEMGNLIHVPPYYAHRSINIGNDKLKHLSFFPRTSGSDYKQLKEKGGFKFFIVEEDGKAGIMKNPVF